MKAEYCHKNTPIPAGFLHDPVHFLALGFGSGCLPRMPGTAGTLVGVICYLPLARLDDLLFVAVVSGLVLAGIGLCHKTARDLGVHDHGAIVWDEITGFMVTMIAIPEGWPWIAAGFLLFRLFDICKPWPVNWFDRHVSGGLGIMLDDVIAAGYALIILQISAYLLYS